MKNELIMTQATITALMTAYSVCAHQKGDVNWLVISKSQKDNGFSQVYLPGTIFGRGNGESSALLWCGENNVFGLLQPGDSISLEWHVDYGSQWTREKKLSAQRLHLIVDRTKGKKQFRFKILLEHEVTDMDNRFKMCRGFEQRTSVPWDRKDDDVAA